jgi:hypothetical protein
MTISKNTITENITLQGINPDKNIKVAYGFLGSRTNRFVNYFGFSLGGDLLISGISNLNNNSVFNLLPAVAICQYDPQTNDAVLSTLTNGNVYGLEYFIWDRPQDNKLYARFKEIESDCDFVKYYMLQQRLDFFNVSSENMNDKVQDILNVIACPIEISGDINNDCEVNMLDLLLLAGNWMRCERTDCE